MKPNKTRVSRRDVLRGGLSGLAVTGTGYLNDDGGNTGSKSEPPDVSDMRLVFEDSFESGSLDTDRWITKYPWDSRTHNYDGYASPDNAYHEEDRIVLKAEEKSQEGMSYTTGVISSTETFSTGYIEADIKIPPATPGFWPAFWMTPAHDWPPEIDVFEFFGADPEAYMSYHYLNANDERERARASFGGANFSVDYCDFGVDWSSERIVWYVDGAERFRYDGDFVTTDAMHVIFNLGIDPDFLDSPDPQHLPATLEIDSLSVWQR